MQKAYDDDVSPANIAKVKGFNPFKLLKYSFWHCSPVFLFFLLDVAQCKDNSLD
jgi:hypothetical protein